MRLMRASWRRRIGKGPEGGVGDRFSVSIVRFEERSDLMDSILGSEWMKSQSSFYRF